LTRITPQTILKNISGRPYGFFLDSASGLGKLSRYSFAGRDPFLVFKSKKDSIILEWDSGRTERIKANPFFVLRELLKKFKTKTGSAKIPFTSGAVGYFGYDMKDFIEVLPDIAIDDIGIPDCIIGFYDEVLAYDNLTHKIYGKKLEFKNVQDSAMNPRIEETIGLKSNFSKEDYIKTVNKAKEYIRRGDIYQVNLSQRFESRINMEPHELYLRLRDFSPAPFSSYLNFGDCTVISSSPERFLMKKGPYIETRPIKGTRPRSSDPLMDEFNRHELVKSYKDRAEHIMIVDLERNDLGRICEYGSVKPTEFIALKEYSTVFHLVSTISGRLKKNIDAIDCLLAAFPGGSITGAPKIRSMEIIEELEPVKRAIYTGAIGYISFDGNMDTSIVIRTILVKGKNLYFQVGGGIVYDSNPGLEYEETLDKAKGIMQAISIRDIYGKSLYKRQIF
jgi:para-aminobenzoate synthetase component 1